MAAETPSARLLTPADARRIVRRAGAVDLVVGSQNYHRLPDMIARLQVGEKIIDTASNMWNCSMMNGLSGSEN